MKKVCALLCAALLVAVFAGCSTTAGVNWSNESGASGFFGGAIQKTFGR